MCMWKLNCKHKKVNVTRDQDTAITYLCIKCGTKWVMERPPVEGE